MSVTVVKTPAAAKILGIGFQKLHRLVRDGIIPAPGRDTSGHYTWSPADLAAARKALAERARKAAGPRRPGQNVSMLLEQILEAGAASDDERVADWFRRLKAGDAGGDEE